MNDSDKFLDRLFTSARTTQTDTSKPEYAFEVRLMARIREIRDPNYIFLRLAWRMIPLFCLIVIGLGAWSFAFPPDFVPAAIKFSSIEFGITN